MQYSEREVSASLSERGGFGMRCHREGVTGPLSVGRGLGILSLLCTM
jgi:hypothetical protein